MSLTELILNESCVTVLIGSQIQLDELNKYNCVRMHIVFKYFPSKPARRQADVMPTSENGVDENDSFFYYPHIWVDIT